jgi:hypothetical protein
VMSANKDTARSRNNIFRNPNCSRRYARDETLSTKIVNLNIKTSPALRPVNSAKGALSFVTVNFRQPLL